MTAMRLPRHEIDLNAYASPSSLKCKFREELHAIPAPVPKTHNSAVFGDSDVRIDTFTARQMQNKFYKKM
ncbi:unnamed protein product [Dibothriocephalus latus]|uniref:Uncharacterized protein n=1 Tax=Dibothriocephalus latus TaxID=60516 RepID=A0A3P7MBT1_DIBLA|nr:unnamed protein product [Dibothriocephalus latus]